MLYVKEPVKNQVDHWLSRFTVTLGYPDSKVHGANMGPIWGRQDPGGTHVGHMNSAIWEWILYAAKQGIFWQICWL